MDRVRTCQLNGHSRYLSFSAIIIVTIVMMVVMIMIVAPCCPLSLFGFMKHYYSAYSWQYSLKSCYISGHTILEDHILNK